MNTGAHTDRQTDTHTRKEIPVVHFRNNRDNVIVMDK